MDDKFSPEIASFMIRFVQDQRREPGGMGYRGVVRHVQTGRELIFTCWEEAEAFIQQIIPLENESTDKRSEP